MTDNNTNHEKLYILGHPVGHSKSPAMYNAFYGKLGLGWDYGFMDIPTIQDAEKFIADKDWLSINITTPYKPEAYEAATHKAATAQLSKGVNLLISHADALLGYNVDGEGCVRFLQSQDVQFKGKDVVVCGTGPTSISILNACVQAGASHATLIGRDKDRAARIMERYLGDYRHLLRTAIDVSSPSDTTLSFEQAYENAEFHYGSYETSKNAIHSADVIIDATPLGMNEGDQAPFDTSLLHAGQTVMDTVYGHGQTDLVSKAKEAGARVFDGAGMLIAQAAITATILCEVKGVDNPYSFEETFSIMKDAAF